MITYASDANNRSIPRFSDGLKESQRKILFTVISLGRTKEPYKIALLSNKTSESCGYHHGEKSLEGASAMMAADYICGSNLALLEAHGNFGSRYHGGQDAGDGRYIRTRISLITPKIFNPRDNPVLEYALEDGKPIEPITYYPIIPMILVNGSMGMGVGYSTKIPRHNPIDVINWYLARITGDKLPGVFPWYDGFTGKTEILRCLDDKDIEVKLESDEDEDSDSEAEANNVDEPEVKTYSTKAVFYGIYEVSNRDDVNDTSDVFITELPIGITGSFYLKFIEELHKKEKIADYTNKCEKNIVEFTLTGFKGKVDYKELKLKSTISLSNMNALDNSNKVTKYKSVEAILESYYAERLHMYVKRKNYELDKLMKDIEFDKMQLLFIKLVCEKKIEISSRTKRKVLDDMVSFGIPEDIVLDVYKGTKISYFTTDGVAKVKDNLEKHSKEYDELSKATPEEIWYGELLTLKAAYKPKFKKQAQVDVREVDSFKQKTVRAKKTGPKITIVDAPTKPKITILSAPVTPKKKAVITIV